MWSVVHFKLDDTVEVVPENWCIKKGCCAWPNTKKISELKNAVINRIKPKKNTFNFFEARTLASNIDDFQVAQKKCSVAKTKSDLSSSEDTLKHRKVRKQKVVNNSDSADGEFSDNESSDSMPSLSSTDDELQVKKSNELSLKSSMQQQKLTISKDPGWSPLKCSVIESSDAQITSTPVPQKTDPFITDIKSLKSKSKYYHNDIGNSSVPSEDDVNAQTNHSNKTSLTTKIAILSPQKFVDNSSGLNSTIIAKGDHPHSSLAKRSLFSDLDESPSLVVIDSPINISSRTLSADHCVIIKSTESKSSNSKQQKTLHKDEQYAKLLNFMVTTKYELRSIQEKLDIIIQRDEEKNLTKTNDFSIYDTADIDTKLPIKTQEKLEELENELSNNKHYRCLMVKRLSSVGGRSIKIMVKRIMALTFFPELLCEFSYNGRGNKKRTFQKLLVNKVIFVLTIKKFAMTDNATNEIEQIIKYVLIQTPFKIKDRTARKDFV
ncbi:uncharacterized protein LOC112598296 [Melanaphis sacchari]|uniref:uncharacterized protein LOC112598296 n=1 Tax=Melanaphis sacchari TaxID=742174 RepID=UPI000DC13780|nr:uncharacterized protein LOC112598296 [Melanaphis sacchari]